MDGQIRSARKTGWRMGLRPVELTEQVRSVRVVPDGDRELVLEVVLGLINDVRDRDRKVVEVQVDGRRGVE